MTETEGPPIAVNAVVDGASQNVTEKDRSRGGEVNVVVDAARSGKRLDAFVAGAVGVSTAVARQVIAAGAVSVDGRLAAKGARVVKGASVRITPVGGFDATVAPDDSVGVVVVYEDDHLIAIDKPAGMPSHPLRPGERGCAANAIVARHPECGVASPDPREGGLAHRLDTPTSGVLIAARSRVIWTGLRRALGADDCEKRYLAQVWGAPPAAGHIDAEIGRSGRRGERVRIGGGRQPRPAETNWTVVARGPETCLVEARLHRGRPHQVRAHLAAAGFPIVGDDRYGGVRDAATSENPEGTNATTPVLGLRLHAASVTFRHPSTGALLDIVAPPPRWAHPDAIR